VQEVVAALALGVGDRVDPCDHTTELLLLDLILDVLDLDSTPLLHFNLDLLQLALDLDGKLNVPPRVLLD